MLETINATSAVLLFGGAIYFWILCLIVLITFFYAEYESNGYIALVGFLGFLFVTHFWSDIELSKYISWNLTGFYIGIGFVYAGIRSYFYGRKRRGDHIRIIIRDLKENVLRWWFIWPISIISWVFSDLLAEVWDVVYAKVNSLFIWIVKRGLNGDYKEDNSDKH